MSTSVGPEAVLFRLARSASVSWRWVRSVFCLAPDGGVVDFVVGDLGFLVLALVGLATAVGGLWWAIT